MTRREFRVSVIKYLYQVFISRNMDENVKFKVEELLLECDEEIKNTVIAIINNEEHIKKVANKYIKKTWNLDRFGYIPNALLYLGIYELLYTNTAHKIIINEILDIAHLYCDDDFIPFINGLLDNVYNDYIDGGNFDFKYTENIDEEIKNYNYENQDYAVLLHITDQNKQILLQKRGNNARDEKGLYEDIGGKVEKNESYKDAIIRELKEEAGENINIKISKPVGIYHCKKEEINWIFIVFIGEYISGEFTICEKDKCDGYKFFEYYEAINSDELSKSCKFITKELKNIKVEYE